MKKLLLILLCLPILTLAQQTYVPDNYFETYLETHNRNGGVVPIGDTTSMGDGIALNNTDNSYPSRWQGSNILGWALMEIRAELK